MMTKTDINDRIVTLVEEAARGTDYEQERRDSFARRAYGMETEVAMIESMGFHMRLQEPAMLVMSILSDAQHMLEMEDNESARQFMNKAKWVTSYFLMAAR